MGCHIVIIVVFALMWLWFLVPTVASEITEPPPRHYEEIDKRVFPCSEKRWHFFLTRDRIFRSLGLTEEQREEIKRLRKQFRDDLLDFKRRHNESLLNILDDTQRLKLEEKSGEIDRYLEEKSPHWYYRKFQPRDDRLPPNDDDIFIDLNFLEVGTNKKLTESDYPYVGIDPITWGMVKKDFKE